MPLYRRHLRHSAFDRVRHSDNFLDFLNTQAAELAGTGTGDVVTFDNSDNHVVLAGHGFVAGQGPFLLSNSGGALPNELSAGTEYWVSILDANGFFLHTTEEDAVAGTNIVAFTDNGSGTSTLLRGAEAVDIFLALKDGKTARQIRGLTSIDNL